MDKVTQYHRLTLELTSILQGENNSIARCSTMVCLLAQTFKPRFFWTGVYIVDPINKKELVIGPYQGTLGCLRIKFGRGVCGTAAAQRETMIVPNVHEFPDHIACDSKSNSEIVVPMINSRNDLVGVLDIDSKLYDAFDHTDASALESLVAIANQY